MTIRINALQCLFGVFILNGCESAVNRNIDALVILSKKYKNSFYLQTQRSIYNCLFTWVQNIFIYKPWCRFTSFFSCVSGKERKYVLSIMFSAELLTVISHASRQTSKKPNQVCFWLHASFFSSSLHFRGMKWEVMLSLLVFFPFSGRPFFDRAMNISLPSLVFLTEAYAV